jgi:hypothetical protein
MLSLERFDFISKKIFVYRHGSSRKCLAHHQMVRCSNDSVSKSIFEVNPFWKCSSLFYPGKEASWERVLVTFEKYAALFKKEYGCVPVLILDNCDRLAKNDSKTLEILQDSAKRAVDNSNWVAVFVMAVGNTLEQMEGLEFRHLRFLPLTRMSEAYLSDRTEGTRNSFLCCFLHRS